MLSLSAGGRRRQDRGKQIKEAHHLFIHGDIHQPRLGRFLFGKCPQCNSVHVQLCCCRGLFTPLLLYDCIMTIFNLVTSKKTMDWFKDHVGKIPLFPTYIALLSDKLFVGFVKSTENYIDQYAV